MNKPKGYDESESFTGEFESLPPGGQICVIKQAKIDKTKTGKEVVILIFDIAEGLYKDFYKREFDRKKENNPDVKWKGVYRQITEGKSLPFFKGMITSIEESNSGFKWNWDENALKNLMFGGVFGQEEWRNNKGNIVLITKIASIRSVEQIKAGVKIPNIVRLDGSSTMASVNDPDDGDLPF